MKQRLLFIFLMISSFVVNAQGDTAVIFKNTKYFYLDSPFDYHLVDTLPLHEVQQYKQFKSLSNPHSHLGDIGLPSRSFWLQHQENISLDLGYQGLDFYKNSSQKIKFYNTPEKAFTRLFFTQGGPQDNAVFSGEYARNFGDYVNVSLSYNRHQNIGTFANQSARHTIINSTISWRDKSDRARGYVYFANNDIKLKENGGLADPSSIYGNLDIDRASLIVNTNNGRLDEIVSLIGTENHIAFGKKDLSQRFLSHRLQYDYTKHLYEDKSISDFYQASYKEATAINQQLKVKTFSNTIALNFAKSTNRADSLANKKNPITYHLLYNIGLQVDAYQLTRYALIENQTAFFAFGNWMKKGNNSNTKLSIRGGINDRRWVHHGLIKQDFFIAKDSLTLQLQSTIKRPFESQEKMIVNSVDILWDDKLGTIAQNTLSANYFNNKTKILLEGNVHLWNNYVFFDELQLPSTIDSETVLLQLALTKNLHWRKLHLDNKFFLQSSNQEQLNLPNWMTKNSLYFKDKIFKNRLLFNVGADLLAVGDHASALYQPLFTDFYASRNTIPTILSVDGFLSFRIQRFQMFFKLENVLGSKQDPIFTTPNTTLRDRYFRFGISWAFFDQYGKQP